MKIPKIGIGIEREYEGKFVDENPGYCGSVC